MSRFSGGGSFHWIRCRLDYRGEREWVCISEWDTYIAGDRLRYPRSTRTVYGNERDARRWARKYKVDLPLEPEKS